jgi:phosphatidate phosphatase APP1
MWIESYGGLATPEGLELRGRVLRGARPIDGRAGRARNLGRMIGLFLTDEMPGVEVRAGGQVAVTDREGYFVLTVPQDGGTGWRDVPVTAGDVTVPVAVFVPGPEAWVGAISDIDDTVMRTGAWSLAQNLRTTFTGSLDRREVFGDAVGLMAALAGGGVNPVFYVSSSPWNMHAFLVELFARAGLARGPLLLRDYGFGRGQVVAERTVRHKGRWIDRIVTAHPGLRFVLVGDTGQHDAAIYADAVARHPGRVAHVILRQAGPRGADAAAIARMEAMGVRVDAVADFRLLGADVAERMKSGAGRDSVT